MDLLSKQNNSSRLTNVGLSLKETLVSERGINTLLDCEVEYIMYEMHINLLRSKHNASFTLSSYRAVITL